MTTFEELEKELRIGLTLIAKEKLNEDLTWIRQWDKTQFEKENLKSKILKIKKKKRCSLTKAIDYFISEEYIGHYKDPDFDSHTELLYEIADEYIKELEKTQTGLINDIFKDKLDDPVRDYFLILLDEIVMYDWNDKQLVRMIKNLK